MLCCGFFGHSNQGNNLVTGNDGVADSVDYWNRLSPITSKPVVAFCMTGSRGAKCVHRSNRYLKVLYKYPYSQPYLFRSKQKKAGSFDSHWDLDKYVLLNLFRTKTASFFRIVPPRTLTVFALGREP